MNLTNQRPTPPPSGVDHGQLRTIDATQKFLHLKAEFTLRDSGFLTIVIKTSLQILSMEWIGHIEV
jgi:hypothetical protein